MIFTIHRSRRGTEEMSDMNKNNMSAPGNGMRPMRPGGRRGVVMNVEKSKDAKGTALRLMKYIGSGKYLFIALVMVMVISTLINLAGPSFQQKAIDCLAGAIEGVFDKNEFFRNIIFLCGTYLLSFLFTYFQGIFSARLSMITVRKLRYDLFSKIVRLPIKYTDTHNHGDIMSRMTNDVENISNTVTASIGSLISGILSVTGSIVIMFIYSWQMTLISISTVILTVLASIFMSKYMRKYYKKQQVLLGELNGHTEEMVTGYKTVVAFNRQEKSKEEFNSISDRLRLTGIRAQAISGSMGPLMNIISNLNFLLVAIAGAAFAFKGYISLGTIQAFLLYSKQLSRPINEIANQYAGIQTALAGAERIFEVMDTDTEKDDGKDFFSSENVRGEIEFKNVNFSYNPSKQVIHDFSLHINSGDKIAIVGATGSGKTTLVNLLTRFYDIDSGDIMIDGKSIFNIPKDELRKSIAIVLQDTVLFCETVENNIKYGNSSASAEDVKKAAVSANAHRFIEKMPRGYDTMLAESGGNLSQGQRQLLSIARAVLADPKILILDEATSSVDTRTEMEIQQAMLKLMKNRTSLIIAHRLSTIRDADMIIVIDNGTIAEMGNHNELISAKGCYYRLYQNQFAGIET